MVTVATMEAESGPLPLPESEPGSRTRLRREQRRAYVRAFRGRLEAVLDLAQPISDLQRRLAIAAPVVATELEGLRPSSLHRKRRNTALHVPGIDPEAIAKASGRELNAMQRSTGGTMQRAEPGRAAAALQVAARHVSSTSPPSTPDRAKKGPSAELSPEKLAPEKLTSLAAQPVPSKSTADLERSIEETLNSFDERIATLERSVIARHTSFEHGFEERTATLERSFENRYASLEHSFEERTASLACSVEDHFASLEHSFEERTATLEHGFEKRTAARERCVEDLLLDARSYVDTHLDKLTKRFEPLLEKVVGVERVVGSLDQHWHALQASHEDLESAHTSLKSSTEETRIAHASLIDEIGSAQAKTKGFTDQLYTYVNGTLVTDINKVGTLANEVEALATEALERLTAVGRRLDRHREDLTALQCG